MESYCPNCMAKVNQEAATQCPVCGAEMTQENRPHQLPVMTILRGRYLVGRVLGEGGFGITYIGRDMVLGQRVAIKEFYPSGSAARHSTISLTVRSISQTDDAIIEKGRSGFLKEAQAIARFRDVPSVVNVNDFFMENGTSYIVMEYLDGQSLQQWLKEKGPVRDFDTLYEMLRPVMDGLEKVHQAGIIHRDISPSNLMMNGSGEIKILDFGTARGFGQEDEKSLSVVLKPGFAPVEQYRRHGKQGPWTDVYALCATLYKLLTGVTPESSVDRIVEDTLKLPSTLGAVISPEQEKALMAGLAVDADKRTQSVAQLIKELDEGSKDKKEKETEVKTDTNNEETSKPKRKKKKIIVLIILAALVILFGLMIFAPSIFADVILLLMAAAPFAAIVLIVKLIIWEKKACRGSKEKKGKETGTKTDSAAEKGADHKSGSNSEVKKTIVKALVLLATAVILFGLLIFTLSFYVQSIRLALSYPIWSLALDVRYDYAPLIYARSGYSPSIFAYIFLFFIAASLVASIVLLVKLIIRVMKEYKSRHRDH